VKKGMGVGVVVVVVMADVERKCTYWVGVLNLL
jgi:hypothetical protein